MIIPDLHKNAVPLSPEKHGQLRLRRDYNPLLAAAAMNACMINAYEIIDASRDYPVVFVGAGKDPKTGQQDVAPVAMFGLQRGENLYWADGKWNAEYVPAFVRAHPFAIAPGAAGGTLCIDESFGGLSTTDGEMLYAQPGQPGKLLTEVKTFLEKQEAELQRTRSLGRKLLDLGLLNAMRFEVKSRDNDETQLKVEGVLAVDDEKLRALPDATVVELHRSGALTVIHAHQVSLGLMRRLADRRTLAKAA